MLRLTFIFFVISCAILFSVNQNNAQENSSKDSQLKINLNIDKNTAIQIAEIIFIKKYGKQVLGQKPWNIVETNNIYTISGTLHNQNGEMVLGGVAQIKIRKDTLEVTKFTHGR